MKLDELCRGVLTEKVNMDLEKIVENILDPNTSETKKRKLTINISFSPNSGRDLVDVDITTKTILAPVEGVNTKIVIGKDLKTGKVAMEEWNKQIPGQMVLQGVDTETGEILEPVETENKVLDLRKRG